MIILITMLEREDESFARNEKRRFYFGLMMCLGMVCVMTFYNLSMDGLIGELTLIEGLLSLLIGFIIALALEIARAYCEENDVSIAL